MSESDLDERDGGGGVAELARAFDETFARPPRASTEDTENLLGLRIEGHEYAVRLADVRGLVPDPKIVRVPSPASQLLGIAGLRGNIVPVYSLPALLGHRSTGERSSWVVLVGADVQIGLAFEHFAGTLRVRRRDISSERNDVPGSGMHVRETARVGDTLRGVISIESVIETIRGASRAVGQNKET